MAHEYTDARIREARLIVAHPEQVLVELEKYGAEFKSNNVLLSVVDEHLERSLLARNDPLIDSPLNAMRCLNEQLSKRHLHLDM